MNYRKTQPSLSLTGPWSFAYTLDAPAAEYPRIADVEASGLKILPATVPGNFELDLQANRLIAEPFFGMNIAGLFQYERAHVWYWRRFEAADREGMNAELVFEGLDCFADVYLNGERIASCDNMLVEQVVPVTGKLRGQNELVVHIRPAVEEARKYDYTPGLRAMGGCWEQLYVRKAPSQYGWDIMPRAVSAGIWRPVTLRYLPRERLDHVYLDTTRADRNHAWIDVQYRACTHASRPTPHASEATYEIAVEAVCGDSKFSKREKMLFDAGAFGIGVQHPRLWWPRNRGEQSLYDVRVSLLKDGVEIDCLTMALGIRTIRLERTSVTDAQGSGEFCFYVNGERFFAMGTNWVPVDAYHSRDAERLPRIMAMVDEVGINMIRCWGGNVYENDLFFEACDRLGVIVWQDFAMACAIYPQDAESAGRLAAEARKVVRRLRQHPCLAMWAGDNECDQGYVWATHRRDPNENILTRKVLPDVLRVEDPGRPYLPSSPYMDREAFKVGDQWIPENHPWGPRNYYKSPYYMQQVLHFASEIGVHGCPSSESVRKFISPDKVWPYTDNEEWTLHSTSPQPGIDLFDYRVLLMEKQVRELFGTVPDNLDDYAFASQSVQAEAVKFFIELFRAGKWRRTGILWWNLIDGWPQFSDAVVDYYFGRKLAYEFIRRAQRPLTVVVCEPDAWDQRIVACNDTRDAVELDFAVRDIDTGEAVAAGHATAAGDAATHLATIPWTNGAQRFYVTEWQSPLGACRGHYLSGHPPFDLERYRGWLRKAGLIA